MVKRGGKSPSPMAEAPVAAYVVRRLTAFLYRRERE